MSEKSEKVKALTIASLGFTRSIQNMLLKEYLKKIGEEYPSDRRYEPHYGRNPEYLPWFDNKANTLTVGDLISGFGPSRSSQTKRHGGKHFYESVVMRRFKQKLLDLGLGFGDWLRLAPTLEAELYFLLQRAGKNKGKIGALNVTVLLHSELALQALEIACNKSREEITVSDLLATSPKKWLSSVEYSGNIDGSFRSARQKLTKLGFTWRDGLFLDEGTRRWHVAKLAKDLKVSHRRASMILDYAHENGWGPKVID